MIVMPFGRPDVVTVLHIATASLGLSPKRSPLDTLEHLTSASVPTVTVVLQPVMRAHAPVVKFPRGGG